MVKSTLESRLALFYARDVAPVLFLKFKLLLKFLRADSSTVRKQSLRKLVIFPFYPLVLSLSDLQVQTTLSSAGRCH